MRKRLAFIVVFLNVCSIPSVARGDPMTLSGSSFLGLDFEGDLFNFVGTSFNLFGRNDFGVFIPRVQAPSCDPCFVGDVVNFSFRTTGEVNLGSGEGNISGVAFPSLIYRGSLQFDVRPVEFPDVPPDHVGAFSISAPFVFTGFVRAFDGDNEVFAQALRGIGVASHPYIRFSEDGPFQPRGEGQTSFSFDDAAPVPEPSTMVLVGLGTVVLSRLRKSARFRSAARQEMPI